MILIITVLLNCCSSKDENPILPFILTGENTKERYLYTDLLNDTIFKKEFSIMEFSDTFSLDANNDEIEDIKFLFYYRRSPGDYSIIIYSLPLNGTQVAVESSRIFDQYYSPSPLSFGDTIHNDLYWLNEKTILYEFFSSQAGSYINGYCYEQEDKYLAIKIQKEFKKYFGWINFSTLNNFLEIDDYAVSKYQASWW